MTCRLDGQLGNQFYQIANMLAYAWDNGLTPGLPNIEIALGGKENKQYFYKMFQRYQVKNIKDIEWSNLDELKYTDYRVYKKLPYEFKTNVCLRGFFMSHKYFSKYRDRILSLFQLPLDKQKEIKQRFKNIFSYKNTVAVHIRTGDPNVHCYYAGLDFYYQKMSQFDKQTLFVVCSDRPDWIKKHFKNLPFNIFYPESDHITEFYLMTQCNHTICSLHSTYGFWAAYLNLNPNKRVFAHNGTTDLDWYPCEWDVETFPPQKTIDYPDMKLYENTSLDNV